MDKSLGDFPPEVKPVANPASADLNPPDLESLNGLLLVYANMLKHLVQGETWIALPTKEVLYTETRAQIANRVLVAIGDSTAMRDWWTAILRSGLGLGPLSAQVEKAWVAEYGFTADNGRDRARLPGVYMWIGHGVSDGNGGRKREVYGGQSVNIHERWKEHRRIASTQRFHCYMRETIGLSELRPKDGVSGVMSTPTGNGTNRTLVECVLNVALGINSKQMSDRKRRWRRRLSLIKFSPESLNESIGWEVKMKDVQAVQVSPRSDGA